MYRNDVGQMDVDGSGKITGEEFTTMPEIAMSPLVTRILSLFDADNSGQVTFDEFVRALSVLSDRGSDEEKLKFAFRVYDVDDDGFVTQQEMVQMMKLAILMTS